MATSKRSKKTTNSKEDTNDTAQAQAQTEVTLAQLKKEEEARKKAEEKLMEAQEILTTNQKEVEKERRSRKKVEKALTKAQEALNATQVDLDQERQAREQAEQAQLETENALSEMRQLIGDEDVNKEHRISFIIRVTVDERGHPKRTEIVNVKSGKKKGFSTLNGDELADFMKANLSLFQTSSAKSSANEIVVPPTTSRVDATVSIDSVQLFRQSDPEGISRLLSPYESFGIQTYFGLKGPDAQTLTAQGSVYEIEIKAYNVIQGKADLIGSHSGKLVKDQLIYSDFVGYVNLPTGLYRPIAKITINCGPNVLSDHKSGPAFHIIGDQQLVSSEVIGDEILLHEDIVDSKEKI